MGNPMDCRDARRLMPLFLRGKLDSLDLDALIDHVIECKPCEAHLLAMTEVSEG